MIRSEQEPWVWRAAYLVAVALVLGAFFFSLRGILNPVVLFLLLALFVSPYTGSRTHLLVVGATGLLTAVWLLDTLGSLLAPFFLALGFAYILQPLVVKLQARGLSRGLAIALLSLPLLVGIALLVLVGFPALGREVAALINGIPAALTGWANRLQLALTRRDYPYVDEQALLARIRSIRPEAVLQYLQGRQAEIARRAWSAVLGAGQGISFLLTILGYLFLTPILTFYLLRDWERIVRALADLIPGVSRTGVTAFFARYDRLLAGYLRGSFLESSIVGALTAVGLLVAGIPFWLLLGVTAAVFNLIPYMGLILTLIPALFVALFTASPGIALVKVVAIFAVVQALDGAVIGPKVVGESVGLHPVWVILSLSVAGFFWGFVGLLLAVPLAVLLKLLLGAALERYRRSPLYVGASA